MEERCEPRSGRRLRRELRDWPDPHNEKKIDFEKSPCPTKSNLVVDSGQYYYGEDVMEGSGKTRFRRNVLGKRYGEFSKSLKLGKRFKLFHNTLDTDFKLGSRRSL